MAMHVVPTAESENVTEDVLTLKRDGVVGKKGAFAREFVEQLIPSLNDAITAFIR